MIAINNVTKMAKEHGVSERVDILLQLFQSYALSQGMYASHVWCTSFLPTGNVFTSKVQMQHLRFLRCLVKARRSTCSWALLEEFGQKPFHFYWWRSTIKFWNCNIGACNSNLFKAVMRSDITLAEIGCNDCWTSEVRSAIRTLPRTVHRHVEEAEGNLMAGVLIDWEGIDDCLAESYTSLWKLFDGVQCYRTVDAPMRKSLTYAKCFKSEVKEGSGTKCVFSKCQKFYNGGFTPNDVSRIARFRLGSHNLQVERGRFAGVPWNDRCCSRCDSDFLDSLPCPVDDEHHMLFDCQAFNHLRDEAISLMMVNSDLLDDFSVRDFLKGDERIVYRFISDCMNFVDDSVAVAGTEAEQPSQAEGLPL